jgi:hypothetical protein
MQVMQRLWRFVITTVKGGVFFFLPLVFCWIVLQKAIGIISGIVQPLAERLGIDALAGRATLGLLVGLVILLICFFGGLLLKVSRVKRVNQRLERFLGMFFPQYMEMRSKVTEIKSKVTPGSVEPTEVTVLTTESSIR